MSGNFNMDQYIDVAARIAEFRGKHSEGSLQQLSLDFREVNGGWWVIYTAAAYRNPDDPRPGHGTAWEPIPGRTNFTKDSEVQNAETAAWGRAIVAVLAADTKRGVASADEVRNARERQAAPPDPAQALKAEIAALAVLDGNPGLVGVKDRWAEDHGGQDIRQATDVAGLTALRDKLSAVAA